MSAITAFDVSIDLNLRGLRALQAMLAKASLHPMTTTGEKPHVDLPFQVQCCVNLATSAFGLLTSAEQNPPEWGGESTIEQMLATVDKVIELIDNGAEPADLEGVESRTLEVTYGNGQTAIWGGKRSILGYNIPNFMFHVCMATRR